MPKKRNVKKPEIIYYVLFALLFAIFQFVLEFWLENASSDIYDFINGKCPNTLRTVFIVVIELVVFLFFHNSVEKFYADEISKKDEMLKEESLHIFKRYHDLQKYKTEETLNNAIINILKKEEYLLAAQLYQYEIMHTETLVSYKISYYTGNVKERVDINSIMQNYYYVESSFIESFYSAITSFDNGNVDPIIRFISDVKKDLEKKQISRLTKNDAFHFELLQLAVEYMINGPAAISIIDSNKVEKIAQLSRLGIVRGIINKGFYFFSNLHQNHKKNRIYMTKTLVINSVNYVLLLSVDPAIKRNFDDYSVKIGEISDSFINELGKCVEIHYDN